MPAFFLLNNKRAEIAQLEAEHGVQILILPDGRLRPDEYAFEMEGTRSHAAAREVPPEPPSTSSRGKGDRGKQAETSDEQTASAK
jgi:hypothetical protein